MNDPAPRVRREPPRFRHVAVQRIVTLGPRVTRVTLGGPEFEGFAMPDVAASVRVLLPASGASRLVVPQWNGNEFLLPDGARPAIRTFTPLRTDRARDELDIEIVLHDIGAASEWVRAADSGDEVALSGPGRGYAIDASAPRFVIGGDETALPAIGQLVAALPPTAAADVHVEIAHADARRDDAVASTANVAWHVLEPGAAPGSALAAAIGATTIGEADRIWIAGEAAGVQRIRRHLFEERGVTRTRATVRGYWKYGRTGDTDGEG